jgi:cellulose synthase/poly-beta-1,6-N-acetylglucosamine synthase-like glycosyltransferase
VDADVVLDKNLLKNLMKSFIQYDIVGACGKLTERYRTRLSDRWRSVYLKQHFGDELIFDPDFVYGSNNAMREEEVLKIGLFGTKYRTNYEDVNLSQRLNAAGYHTLYQPAASGEQLKRDSLLSVFDMDWRWWIFNSENTPKYSNLGLTIRTKFQKSLSYLKEDIRALRFALALVDLFHFIALNYYDVRYRSTIKTTVQH